jgi:type II secretory pathway predicted ATPase ExeA
MAAHPLLEPFQSLHISYRTAAREMGIAHGTLYDFLNGVRQKVGTRKNPAALIRGYIDGKRPAMRVKAAPMIKKMFGMGLGLDEAAKAMGLSAGDLSSYAASGLWPNREMVERFKKWLDEQKEKGRKKMITKMSLNAEAIEHFGLDRDPFTNEMEALEDILDTRELARAEKKMMLALEKGGWTTITGPVGSGKTTLTKRFDARVEKKKGVVVVKPRTIEKQYLRASHICDSILEDLKCEEPRGRRTLEYKARLVGRMLEQSAREGKRIVILIDEAHLLTDDALLALKRIYEIELGFTKLVSIILVGQERLARRLKSNVALSEVSQRIDLYELGALNGALGDYIEHKLKRAGMNGNREVFDKSALKEIGKKADSPLSVNNLAAAAMMHAWDAGEKVVTGEMVRAIPESY